VRVYDQEDFALDGPAVFLGAPGPACSASSASFTHSSANTRHVTLLTSSTAASARRRHCSAERRQRAGKSSVSWTALTGPSRRRCLVRRYRRLLWPALASRRDTCAAVREPSRDWLPGRHGSPGGTCQDLPIATSDWPLRPSHDWRRATCGGPLGVSQGLCTALILAARLKGFQVP
jgi:hypothetical protein